MLLFLFQVADGFQVAVMAPVVVFVVLRLPFVVAAVINLCFLVLVVCRYVISFYGQSAWCRETCFKAGQTTLRSSDSWGSQHIAGVRGSTLARSFLAGASAFAGDAATTDEKHCLCVWNLITYAPVLLGIQALAGFVGYRMEYNQRKRFLLDSQVGPRGCGNMVREHFFF